MTGGSRPEAEADGACRIRPRGSAMVRKSPFEPGQRIGNYILVEKIGQGAFAEVWKASHHERPGSVVAIKIATSPEFRRQLSRESRLPDIGHPNVVRILDADTGADPPYIVMPYYPGGSLADLIQRHPHGLPEERVEQILGDILAGLSAAHASGIIHRDIKPSNILLDADGRALLADFGLSRHEYIWQSVSLERERAAVVGTFPYMAPEVRDSGASTAASDVYSVGVVLFEMLTGRLPQGTERPSDVRSGLTRGTHWDRVFGRACAGLNRRPADARAMVAALHAGARDKLEDGPHQSVREVTKAMEPDDVEAYCTGSILSKVERGATGGGIPGGAARRIRRLMLLPSARRDRVISITMILVFAPLGLIGCAVPLSEVYRGRAARHANKGDYDRAGDDSGARLAIHV